MMESTNFQLVMNEFDKLNGRLDDINERIQELSCISNAIIAYLRQFKHNESADESTTATSIFNAAPDDEYLDRLEAEELKQAKEEIQTAISAADQAKSEALAKFNCIYPAG